MHQKENTETDYANRRRGLALAALTAALFLTAIAPAARADGAVTAYVPHEPAASPAGLSETEQDGLVNADGVREDPQHPMSTTARAFRNGIVNGRRIQKAEDEKKYVDLPPLPPGLRGSPVVAVHRPPALRPHVVAEDDNAQWTTIPPQPGRPAAEAPAQTTNDAAIVQPVPASVPTSVAAIPVAPTAAAAPVAPEVVAEAAAPAAGGYTPAMAPGSSYSTTVTKIYTQTSTSYTAPAQPIPPAPQIYNAPVQQVYQAPPQPAPIYYAQPTAYVPPGAAPTQYVYVARPAPPVWTPGYGTRAYVPRYSVPPRPVYYTRGYW
jgi:hypothetical protein